MKSADRLGVIAVDVAFVVAVRVARHAPTRTHHEVRGDHDDRYHEEDDEADHVCSLPDCCTINSSRGVPRKRVEVVLRHHHVRAIERHRQLAKLPDGALPERIGSRYVIGNSYADVRAGAAPATPQRRKSSSANRRSTTLTQRAPKRMSG